eukprot:2454440-Amphidinium_carterae.1
MAGAHAKSIKPYYTAAEQTIQKGRCVGCVCGRFLSEAMQVTADSSPTFALLMGLALTGLCNVLVSLVPTGGSTGRVLWLPMNTRTQVVHKAFLATLNSRSLKAGIKTGPGNGSGMASFNTHG